MSEMRRKQKDIREGRGENDFDPPRLLCFSFLPPKNPKVWSRMRRSKIKKKRTKPCVVLGLGSTFGRFIVNFPNWLTCSIVHEAKLRRMRSIELGEEKPHARRPRKRIKNHRGRKRRQHIINVQGRAEWGELGDGSFGFVIIGKKSVPCLSVCLSPFALVLCLSRFVVFGCARQESLCLSSRWRGLIANLDCRLCSQRKP